MESKIKTIRQLVMEAAAESAVIHHKQLLQVVKAIHGDDDVNCKITVCNNSCSIKEWFNKSKFDSDRTAYDSFLRQKLSIFHSQIKYVQFDYSLISGVESPSLRIRLTKLRKRNITALLYVKNDRNLKQSMHRWVLFDGSSIDQYEADAIVTARDPWYLRLLGWMFRQSRFHKVYNFNTRRPL